MTRPAWQDDLVAVPFFQSLPDSLRWHLVRAAVPTTYEPGAPLFREGQAREFFAVVLSGSVAIEQAHSPTPLATLGAGEVIGEGVLLDDSPHGTSARALVRTEAALFPRTSLDPLLKNNPALHAALVTRAARAIAQRLKVADATLAGRGRTLGFTGGASRREHDLLGDRDVPAEALYGVQTLRALENFPITGVPIREF
ncbi:MAG: cyclic nucleotide-binding domain-containing protein, partial [Gemmatimonadota bacterium]|nr:cyclic nucleotide-binding domain-containing protein [Gemmatimonadota bacterium]